MHRTVEPAILYFGTPVVLVSSQNEDGSPNVAPMSSWRAPQPVAVAALLVASGADVAAAFAAAGSAS